jgi:hypothetical protein
MHPDSRLWSSPAGQRRLYEEWARHPELAQRDEEGDTEYVARMRAEVDLAALPAPLRRGVTSLMALSSACAMRRLTGIAFEALLRPPERN